MTQEKLWSLRFGDKTAALGTNLFFTQDEVGLVVLWTKKTSMNSHEKIKKVGTVLNPNSQ